MEEAVLFYEGGKLVLKSQKGWILWSGSADETHQIKTILETAGKILKIRKRRLKQ